MKIRSSRKKVTDPSGRTIKPLSYRRSSSKILSGHFKIPLALVFGSALFVLLLFAPSGQLNTDSQPSSTAHPSEITHSTPAIFVPEPTNQHGGRIVFTCTRNDINHLCFINADGTNFKQLTISVYHDYYPAFLSIGGGIIFASNRSGDFDIYLMLLSDQKTYQLTRGVGNTFSPKVSPDGKSIIFLNRTSEHPASLWIMDGSGKNVRNLFHGQGSIVGVDWSPDGESIALVMSGEQEEEYGVFLLNINPIQLKPIQLTSLIDGITGSIDWSPDGKSLLICAGHAGDKDIFLLDISSGNLLQLTNGGNNASASYSPDGQWIVFNSLRNNNQADLFIMKADGTYQRQLTEHPEPDWQPQWEP